MGNDVKPRVYCSGALFNEKERLEMSEIAAAFEEQGFETFLPHRDGLEITPLASVLMSMGVEQERAHQLWEQAIFSLDAYQVVRGCDAVVVNLNGRVPDEGAVSEAALAWSAGKVMAAYKDDPRSLYFGKDNAMVTGLFGFQMNVGLPGLVSSIKAGMAQRAAGAEGLPVCDSRMESVLGLGERIWRALRQNSDLIDVARLLIDG